MDKSSGDVSGYLHIRVNSTGIGKIKSGKKYTWFQLDKNKNELQSFKSSEDASKKEPIESILLFGAGISYGDADENEFIINIRGMEYRLIAENHKTMMKWTNLLQKQVKIKPNIANNMQQIKLEPVPEDELLSIKNEIVPERKHKRRSFFRSIFKRKSRRKRTSSINSLKEERVVRAAPLRSVVGSMQDISAKSSSCESCRVLQDHNKYLSGQVQQLNEDVENIKEQLRQHVRESDIMGKDLVATKKDFVNFLQNSFLHDDTTYVNISDIPNSKQVMIILHKEKTSNDSPIFNSDGVMKLHEDYLGFIHGNRETPMQILLYLCGYLKLKYIKELQTSNENYNHWQTYVTAIQTINLTTDKPLKKLIAHGVPHKFRSSIWKFLIEHHVKSIMDEKGGNYYSELMKKLPDLESDETDVDGSIEKQIKIDLLRTMPTHKDFKDLKEGKIPVLHRILRAFLLHNPEIGYCQGMNFMVGYGLLYLDEETCFWLLVAITEVYFSKHHYNMYLSGTQANQRVFETICREEIPDLMKHLDELNCELTPITFNWFMTIFIDSLPVEVVLKIWDCFLLYGHHILYKFALHLLKLQKDYILKLKDSLAVMRKLKRIGKCFHNDEKLLADVFNDWSSASSEYFVKLYNKFLSEIEEKNDKRKREDEEYEKKKDKLKFTPKPMMVSVSDNLDELDDDLIIKCAVCEENRNFVWLLCSSDLMAKIFILNVASRNIFPTTWQVDCKCITMARSSTANIMLVSSIKSKLHAIDMDSKKELWSLQLAGSALNISCNSLGSVGMSLMDGAVAFLSITGKDLYQPFPTYVDISRSPVLAGCIVNDRFWCGAANKIVVINMSTLETTTTLRVCNDDRHIVLQLVPSDLGVWTSVKGSSVIHLWHKTKYYCLLTVDVLDECGLISEKKTGSAASVGITTLMVLKDHLWIGFGNGRFVISDVERRKNSEDDLNDAINLFKSMENLTEKDLYENDLTKRTSKLGVSICCHQMPGETQRDSDTTDFIIVDKRASMMENDNSDLVFKMNQVQRVCEHSVNCFLPCRNDGKLILSCMGALNDDSSLILWSSEKRDGSEMWFAQTVSVTE